MRKFLFSVLTAAPMVFAVGGCTHDTKSDSNGTMKMSTGMACCGDACKKMGSDCCKADDKGKVTCSMGGSCCVSNDKMKM